ncbi:twinfilin-1 [Pochonia chlamydosporia 170]|uniref:Twinfilin-1 n=1 Tax=Pochonia chlamydosporia 170 TaxID=1380566 RepID=A0A179FXG2_METCM|nr:twinfilin-1 [Pochonia chlamydosporia 170]OAQ69908.1 twinfilin-1 [Pochonia chlamydosporia 170]
MSCFTSPVALNGGPLTPEMCQKACQGHLLAALFPTDCRCGDDANAIKPLDERVCNYPCLGERMNGFCGSICPDEGPGIANVYTKTQSVSQQPQVQTLHTTSTLALPVPPTTSEDCTTSEEDPVTDQGPGNFITPAGPAPEIPTTFTFIFTSSGPASASSSDPATGVPPTTSCTEEESSVTQAPTVAPSTTREEDPATPTPSSAAPAPYGTTTASPPMYTSDAQPVPSSESSPQSYSDPVTSEQDQDPAATASSVPDPSQDDPNQPSTGTLWSRPSGVVDPTGQPPVPAQVPGSDSAHSMIPPLATIGGLALIAAIIM